MLGSFVATGGAPRQPQPLAPFVILLPRVRRLDAGLWQHCPLRLGPETCRSKACRGVQQSVFLSLPGLPPPVNAPPDQGVVVCAGCRLLGPDSLAVIPRSRDGRPGLHSAHHGCPRTTHESEIVAGAQASCRVSCLARLSTQRTASRFLRCITCKEVQGLGAEVASRDSILTLTLTPATHTRMQATCWPLSWPPRPWGGCLLCGRASRRRRGGRGCGAWCASTRSAFAGG